MGLHSTFGDVECILIIEKIITKVTHNNIEHYRAVGYRDIVKNETIAVLSNELPPSSSFSVNVVCDYCGIEFSLKYVDYYKRCKMHPYVPKCCCVKCKHKKAKETNLIKYGKTCTLQVPEIKKKILDTFDKRYGGNPLKNENIKNKIMQTCIKKYGVKNPFQNLSVRNKQKDTVREKYGCDNVFQNEKIKLKAKKTMLKKYGYGNVFQVPHLKKIISEKSNKTMNSNGTMVCSKQQKHIHNIVGGKLNYLYDMLWLDIAFPKKKIYIECQGLGHDISVKYKKISKREFEEKEIKKYKFLKSKGWKQIEIISRKDLLPPDGEILNIVNFAKLLLLNNLSNWVKIDIDHCTISYSNNIFNYIFTDLMNVNP